MWLGACDAGGSWVKPRNPPTRPKINPTKLNDITEKPITSIEPIFLCASLLYSSHEPSIVKMPAMPPRIKTFVVLIPGIKIGASADVRKALTRVNIPARNESAKAAVGFASGFVAKAFPDQLQGGEIYEESVTNDRRANYIIFLS